MSPLYFCQSAHEYMVMQSGAVEAADNLVDFGPAPVLSKERCVWMGYIDNSLVASLDPSTTSRARLAIDAQFRRNNLRVHEVTETSTDEAFLGLELDGSQGVLRPSRKRVWKLYQVVTHLLAKPYITSKSLSVILGHFTFLWCPFRVLVINL